MKLYKVKFTDNEDGSTRTIQCDNLFEMLSKTDGFKDTQKRENFSSIDDLLEKGIQDMFKESGFPTMDNFLSHTNYEPFMELVKKGEIMDFNGEYLNDWIDILVYKN